VKRITLCLYKILGRKQGIGDIDGFLATQPDHPNGTYPMGRGQRNNGIVPEHLHAQM
jgi:hypothetical protein